MKASFKPLTKAEEDIMQVLWQLDKGFVKDIIEKLPQPKPHYNTVSTILKILVDKKVVAYEQFGKSNRYYPLVTKGEYSKKSVNQFVKKYFEGSFASMVSFFAKQDDISVSELEDLLKEMKSKKK